MTKPAVAIVVVACLVALALARRFMTIRRRKETMSLDRIRAAVLAQTSVVASVATAISGLVAKVRDEAEKLAAAGADTSGLDDLASQIEANTGALAKAAAVNTDAGTEVHVDDTTVQGGTGSDDTAVDADAVDTTAATQAPEPSSDQG